MQDRLGGPVFFEENIWIYEVKHSAGRRTISNKIDKNEENCKLSVYNSFIVFLFVQIGLFFMKKALILRRN